MSQPAYSQCIDALLGPQARAKGCRCPCPLHTPQVSIEETANVEFSAVNKPTPETEIPKVTRLPHNGKMAAAHDLDDAE